MDSSIAGRHSAPLTHRIWGYLPAACRRLRVTRLCERKPVNRHEKEPMNNPG